MEVEWNAIGVIMRPRVAHDRSACACAKSPGSVSSSVFTNSFNLMRLAWVLSWRSYARPAIEMTSRANLDLAGIGESAKCCTCGKGDVRVEGEEKIQRDEHKMEIQEGESDEQVRRKLMQAQEMPNLSYYLIRER